MNNPSQLSVLLLNIYFNLMVLSPFLNGFKSVGHDHFTSELGFVLSEDENMSIETEIDSLMLEYIHKLKKIKATQNDTQALELVQDASIHLMKQAQRLAPQIKAWKHTLSAQDSKKITDKLLMKPYFREINSITFHYTLMERMHKNPQLKKAFEGMDDFLSVLYN